MSDLVGNPEDRFSCDEAHGLISVKLSFQFRTATCFDVFLMFVGSLAAVVHGAGWPVLFIFFGDMTDQFVNFNDTGEKHQENMSVQ